MGGCCCVSTNKAEEQKKQAAAATPIKQAKNLDAPVSPGKAGSAAEKIITSEGKGIEKVEVAAPGAITKNSLPTDGNELTTRNSVKDAVQKNVEEQAAEVVADQEEVEVVIEKPDVSSYFRAQLKELDVARFNCAKYTDVSQELLDAVKQAQQNVCQAYIKGDVYVEFDEDVDMCLPEPQGALEKLNKLAWAHRVVRPDGSVFKTMTELDCIIIENRRAEIAKNPKKADPKLYFSDLDVDLSTNLVTLVSKEMQEIEKEELKLERIENNDRTRGKGQRKSDGAKFSQFDEFNNNLNTFGKHWYENKNKSKFPSHQQIVKGVRDYFVQNVVELGSRQRGKDIVKKMTKQYDAAFDAILKSHGEKKFNVPIPAKYADADNGRQIPIKDGLFDPDNKQTQTILWLYSMEPSIYSDINRAVREN